jgi:serine/threonine protein kinase
MKFIGDTKKSVAGWLMKFIRRSKFLFKNYWKIRRSLKELDVSDIRIFKFKNWHDSFAYYSGIFKGNIVFIKISTKHFFLDNEKIFYDLFKEDLSLLKVIDFFENDNIQILISEFSDEKELTEQDILDDPDRLLQIYEILKTIRYKDCIHRDIKLNNFLLKNNKVRIIDFTFSTCFNRSNRFNDLSLNKNNDAIILKNLGGILKPNIFQWNDFYSIDAVLERLFSEDIEIEKRLRILKYKELFKENILGNNYYLLK